MEANQQKKSPQCHSTHYLENCEEQQRDWGERGVGTYTISGEETKEKQNKPWPNNSEEIG